MSTGQNLSFSRLASAGASGSAVVALGLLADDDRRGHGAVGFLGTVIEAGLVKRVAECRPCSRRSTRCCVGNCVVARSMLCCSGFSSSTLTPLPSLVAVPLVSLSRFWSTKDLVTKLKVLPSASSNVVVCWSVSLRGVAGVDAGHEAEGDGVAFAGRTVELVDHAAGDAGDAGAVGGLVQRQIVDGAMWRKQLRGKGRQRDENGRTGSSKKCNPHCAHQGTPVAAALSQAAL